MRRVVKVTQAHINKVDMCKVFSNNCPIALAIMATTGEANVTVSGSGNIKVGDFFSPIFGPRSVVRFVKKFDKVAELITTRKAAKKPYKHLYNLLPKPFNFILEV